LIVKKNGHGPMTDDKKKPKKTGNKAERPEDQAVVDKYFGTDDACTTRWAERVEHEE
jgi:hypothetical protein